MKLVKLNDQNYPLLREWRNQNQHYYLVKTYITPERHKQWYRDYCQNPNLIIYLIQHENHYVGCIGINFASHPSEVTHVLLADRKLRRQGIMTWALNEILRLHDVYCSYVIVRADNARAIKFYLKNGFIRASTTEQKDGIDIIKMIKFE